MGTVDKKGELNHNYLKHNAISTFHEKKSRGMRLELSMKSTKGYKESSNREEAEK